MRKTIDTFNLAGYLFNIRCATTNGRTVRELANVTSDSNPELRTFVPKKITDQIVNFLEKENETTVDSSVIK